MADEGVLEPCSRSEALRLVEDEDSRVVASTEVNGILISTAFLPFCLTFEDHSPQAFETVVIRGHKANVVRRSSDLAESFTYERPTNYNDEVEKHFRVGAHVEGRDAIAARRTFAGLLMILHPGGDWTKEELEEYLQLALEGRRRVKQQLKKRGSFEFYKTRVSYIDQASGAERVGVPEQGGTGMISQDPSPPAVFTPPLRIPPAVGTVTNLRRG